MSIVEKAIAKLQASGAKKRPATIEPRRSAPAGRVVYADPAVAQLGSERPRMPIGNRSKTVHIDEALLRQAGLMPPEHQQREIDHQYRTLKLPLIKRAFNPTDGDTASGATSRRSIMVSSALPGEGKTFTSINLALSLAMEKDHSVLLVDGDVAKPHISHIFGAADEPGLLDVLGDPEGRVESVLLPTSIEGLSVLPVGRRSDTATELLASARMRQLIEELERFDPHGLVVVDSSPILLTSEARVLAALFGQVVLVVNANTTPQQAVLEAIEIIGEGPRLGLVLNQATHEGAAGSYYGYGYGYGYNDKDFGARGDAPAQQLKATVATGAGT